MRSKPSDEEILDAVRHGKPHAFDAFVQCYGTRLKAFSIRMCGHPEDGEDIYQETLLKAFEGLSAIREPRAIRTWLFRVASNACLMKRRKEARAREISLSELAPGPVDDDRLADLPDWSNLPDGAAARTELREALELALSNLPPEQRIVVVLRDVEGLDTRETAEALELGASAVKMRLHRARGVLRDALLEVADDVEMLVGEPA